MSNWNLFIYCNKSVCILTWSAHTRTRTEVFEIHEHKRTVRYTEHKLFISINKLRKRVIFAATFAVHYPITNTPYGMQLCGVICVCVFACATVLSSPQFSLTERRIVHVRSIIVRVYPVDIRQFRLTSIRGIPAICIVNGWRKLSSINIYSFAHSVES